MEESISIQFPDNINVSGSLGIDSLPPETEVYTEVDTSSGLYGAMADLIGKPTTNDTQNILYTFSCVVVISLIVAMFKVINYLFHI